MQDLKKFEPFFDNWYLYTDPTNPFNNDGHLIQNGETKEISAIKHISIPYDETHLKKAKEYGDTNEYFNKYKEMLVEETEYRISLSSSPNILNVYEYEVIQKEDTVGWDIFIRLEDAKKIPVLRNINDILKMGIDVCTALEYCQEHNITHHNISPKNIYVTKDRIFKLGNFKLHNPVSKSTDLSYISPEDYNKQESDIKADIYSLGIVLYQYLNINTLPFVTDKESVKQAISDRLSGMKFEYPNNAPKALGDIILKACAFNQDERYQTPTELKADLQSIYDKLNPQPKQQPLSSPPPQSPPQPSSDDDEYDDNDDIDYDKEPISLFKVIFLGVVTLILLIIVIAVVIYMNKSKTEETTTQITTALTTTITTTEATTQTTSNLTTTITTTEVTTQATTVLTTTQTTTKSKPKPQTTTKSKPKPQTQTTTTKIEPQTQATTITTTTTQTTTKTQTPPPNPPVPSHYTDTYDGPISVTLFADPGCTIYYTDNGLPVEVRYRKKYYQPIAIKSTTYLTVMAVNEEGVESEQVQYKYTIK